MSSNFLKAPIYKRKNYIKIFLSPDIYVVRSKLTFSGRKYYIYRNFTKVAYINKNRITGECILLTLADDILFKAVSSLHKTDCYNRRVGRWKKVFGSMKPIYNNVKDNYMLPLTNKNCVLSVKNTILTDSNDVPIAELTRESKKSFTLIYNYHKFNKLELITFIISRVYTKI